MSRLFRTLPVRGLEAMKRGFKQLSRQFRYARHPPCAPVDGYDKLSADCQTRPSKPARPAAHPRWKLGLVDAETLPMPSRLDLRICASATMADPGTHNMSIVRNIIFTTLVTVTEGGANIQKVMACANFGLGMIAPGSRTRSVPARCGRRGGSCAKENL